MLKSNSCKQHPHPTRRTREIDMNIPKEKCEQMLDQEADRVARSILQLINSIRFEDKLGTTDKVSIHAANKIGFTIRKVITDEVAKQFIKGSLE